MILASVIAMMIAGAPVAQDTCVPAPPPGHAGARGLPWYVNSEPITVDGKRYVKYGLPRVLRAGDVDLLTRYKTAFIYAERGHPQSEVFYLLTDLKSCEFQPYQLEAK